MRPASVSIKEGTYPVETAKFYDTMFNGIEKPLCKSVDVKGCENAVAATSWHLTFVDGSTLYNAAGRRQTLRPHCDINMLMPKWVDAHKADVVQQRAVAHFLGHTATHERGHGQACSSLAASIALLVSNMPARVPTARVAEFNRAFNGLIELFTRGARAADNEFDKFTGHGGEQDAQLGSHEDQVAAASTAGGVPSGAASDFQTAVRQATAAVVLSPAKASHTGGGPVDEKARTSHIEERDDGAQRALPRRAHTVQLATGFGGVPLDSKKRPPAVATALSKSNVKDTQWLFALAGVVGSILHDEQ